MSQSWGTSTPDYAIKSMDVDRFSFEHPDCLLVFSAGNQGQEGLSKITSPANAKNVLTVGSCRNTIDSFRSAGMTLGFRLVVNAGDEISNSSPSTSQSDMLFLPLADYLSRPLSIFAQVDSPSLRCLIRVARCDPSTAYMTRLLQQAQIQGVCNGDGAAFVLSPQPCANPIDIATNAEEAGAAILFINEPGYNDPRGMRRGRAPSASDHAFGEFIPGNVILNKPDVRNSFSIRNQHGLDVIPILVLPENDFRLILRLFDYPNSQNISVGFPEDVSISNDPISSPLPSRIQLMNENFLSVFSSRGPTSDGRIKPDLVAPGII